MQRVRRTMAGFALAAVIFGGCGGAPGIGHAVSETGDDHCLSCHLDGETLETGEKPPKSPHPDNNNCVSCHDQTGTNDVGALSP